MQEDGAGAPTERTTMARFDGKVILIGGGPRFLGMRAVADAVERWRGMSL